MGRTSPTKLAPLGGELRREREQVRFGARGELTLVGVSNLGKPVVRISDPAHPFASVKSTKRSTSRGLRSCVAGIENSAARETCARSPAMMRGSLAGDTFGRLARPSVGRTARYMRTSAIAALLPLSIAAVPTSCRPIEDWILAGVLSRLQPVLDARRPPGDRVRGARPRLRVSCHAQPTLAVLVDRRLLEPSSSRPQRQVPACQRPLAAALPDVYPSCTEAVSDAT